MIFFRADGNSVIGAGHIMRCLSFASILKEGRDSIRFYTATNDFSDVIIKRATNVVFKTDFTKPEDELYMFKEEIIKYKPRVVFVDSYYVTKKYLNELLECCHSYGGKLIYIDDILSFDYPCDYLINNSLLGEKKKSDYEKIYFNSGVKKPIYLLGVNYLPLREEFINRKKRILSSNAKSILISTGGADIEHMALALIECILDNNDFKQKTYHILIGKANKDKELICNLSNKCGAIKTYYNICNVSKIISSSDVAISAAGGTLYELFAMQTPTITYSVADNQIAGAKYFFEKGLLDYYGDSRMLGTMELAKKMLIGAISLCDSYSLREKMVNNQLQLSFGSNVKDINSIG